MSDILIVDDVPENCRYLANILLEKSYKVRALPNAKLAMFSIKKHPPDLILLDIRMPEIDGFALCEWVKSHDEFASIPIIFLSGSHEESEIIKGFDLGAVDYIRKPFYPLEVYKRIQNQLKLIEKERELNEMIRETLMGSIEAILDMLALVDPDAYAKSNRMGRLMKKLVSSLELSENWRFETAAMLYNLNDLTSVHDVAFRHFESLLEPSQQQTNQHAHIIRRIPRLGEVADMIEGATIEEKPLMEQSEVETGQTLLKILSEFDHMILKGSDVSLIKSTLISKFQNHQEVVAHLIGIYEEELNSTRQTYSLSELISGIILLEDVLTIDGIKLVNKGTQLTLNLISLLRRYNHHKHIIEPIICTK